MTRTVRTLFVTRRPSRPPLAAEEERTWQHIRLLQKRGEVAIFAADGGASTRSCARTLRVFRPDIVIVEDIRFARCLRAARRQGCRIVLDLHRLEGPLARALSRSATGWIARLRRAAAARRLGRLERSLVHAADQVWVASRTDAELLRKEYGMPASLHVIPDGIDAQDTDGTGLSDNGTGIATIVFDGDFSQPGDAEAARTLLHDIYPRIRAALGPVELLLIGSMHPRWMRMAARDDASITLGDARERSLYCASTAVFVAPVTLAGSSTRPLLRAFAHGHPVVCTPEALRGLDAKDTQHVLVGRDAEELCMRVCRLAGDSMLRERLAGSARQLLLAKYALRPVDAAVGRAVQTLDGAFSPAMDASLTLPVEALAAVS